MNQMSCIGLAGVLLAAGVQAQPTELQVSYRAGIVASSGCGKVDRSDDYPLPRDHCEHIYIAEPATVLDASLGANFGLEYQIANLADGACHTLTHVLRHPPMQPPGGESRSRYAREMFIGDCVGGGDHYSDIFSWYLEAPWEVVSGDWIFEIQLDGETLIQQTLTLR